MLKKTIPVVGVVAMGLAQGIELIKDETPIDAAQVQTNIQSQKKHHKKHRKHHKKSKADKTKSVPYCTSFECKNNSVVKGEDEVAPVDPVHEPLVYPDQLSQKGARSIPSCNSHECASGSSTDTWEIPDAIETNHGAYEGGDILAQRKRAPVKQQSVPYCTSFECKNNSVVKGEDERVPVPPVHEPLVYPMDQLAQRNKKTKKRPTKDEQDDGMTIETPVGNFKGGNVAQAQKGKKSIPACNSFECQNGSAVDAWDIPTHVETHHGEYGGDIRAQVNAPHKKPTKQQSIPYCTSFECKNNSAVKGQDEVAPVEPVHEPLVYPMDQLAQRKKTAKSIPSCNSHECASGSATDTWEIPDAIETNHGAYEGGDILAQRRSAPIKQKSVPYCTSFECKNNSVVKGEDEVAPVDPVHEPLVYPMQLSQHKKSARSIPACTSFECQNGSAVDTWDIPTHVETHHGEYGGDIRAQKSAKSIPACNSFECQNGSAVDAWDIPTHVETHHGEYGGDIRAQKSSKSIPACNSFECQNGSAVDAWDIPTHVETHHGEYGGDIRAQKSAKSIPACTSFECQNGSAVDAWDIPTHVETHHGEYGGDIRAQVSSKQFSKSVPSCTSHECHEGTASQNYDVPTVDTQFNNWGVDMAQKNAKSIPACNSFECQNGSAVDAWDIPTHVETHHGEYGGDIRAQKSARSIPACNSFECQNGSAVDAWDIPTHVETHHGEYGGDIRAQRSAPNKAKSVPACNSYECQTESIVKPAGSDHPVDYKVNDLGMDHEIKASIKHMEDQEEKHGEWNIPEPVVAASQKLAQTKPKAQPKKASKKSDPICPSSGCEWENRTTDELGYPINYPVPDYGMDHDVKDSLKHMKDQEEKHGEWELPEPINGTYYVNPDIVASQKAKKPSKQAAVAVQADVRSDPICSSAGCEQYLHPKADEHPMDYPVPDFGVDHEIKASQAHEKAAAEAMGHEWHPDQDVDGRWIVPTEDAEFKLTGTRADVHLESDPAFNSDEGYEVRHSNPYRQGELPADVYYPLNNTLDHDVADSQDNLASTEAALGKKMDIFNVQVGSTVKTAVKAKGKATNKVEAKAQVSEFAKLRESMMSNWGLKK